MGFLILFALRMLPVGLIALVREGHVQPWLVLAAALITGAMVLAGLSIDFIRGHIHANAYNPAVADALQERLKYISPLRLGLWAAHLVMLILLALV